MQTKNTQEGKKTVNKEKLKYIIATVMLSLIAVVAYYISMPYRFFPIVMWGYMAVLAVLVLVYIIYNRGFSRKGVTEDMLPDSWDIEKKREFVENGKKRVERSKWLLSVIIAFVATFFIEAIQLFVLPTVFGWFS